MSERDVMASLERLEALERSVRQVLGDKRWSLTAEEFLENVEAHRRKHDQDQLNPKRINCKPTETKDYQLKRHVTRNRQLELKRLEVSA
jgi:hypothetical protein